ncbi:MAG: hypothetical protein L3K16_01085 [Thermoplasmata archaeon]|nr:hypothetical protein [Thermoplasmata archaeon]
MQFRVASYRGGMVALKGAGAFDELAAVLGSISIADIDARRRHRQASMTAKGAKRTAGIQSGLNAAIRETLARVEHGWRTEVQVFDADEGTDKGVWTIDFHKQFPSLRYGVGLEVTFNHAEALPWTLIRPTLAYQAETVTRGSRIDIGAIIIGTDHLKGPGKDRRMDSAVGTYERLRTLLPKMKWVLPAPMVIFGLDWADGAQSGPVDEIDIYEERSGLPRPAPVMVPIHAVRPNR